ncbi:hypothetical protein N7510_001417 [Penicillium lagena]|uniref:uncharacterized protein n=1 Tax=Penicillium lagena TaxID=94218 RepID=UPI002541010F|nr:uncharacterized protein N7510_001417 [Penicillium lagena]KAJ5625108.1 hypothetical protein N7510_001417 [Penicillium lagena]
MDHPYDCGIPSGNLQDGWIVPADQVPGNREVGPRDHHIAYLLRKSVQTPGLLRHQHGAGGLATNFPPLTVHTDQPVNSGVSTSLRDREQF